VSTRFRFFKPLGLCTHISQWWRHKFVNVIRRRLLCPPNFAFLSPSLPAPVYLNNNNVHLLTSFSGDCWSLFKVFYPLTFSPVLSVDRFYQISIFRAPCSLHPYISTTMTWIRWGCSEATLSMYSKYSIHWNWYLWRLLIVSTIFRLFEPLTPCTCISQYKSKMYPSNYL